MKAFPQAIEESYYDHGMDLRDYFAAKAMQGIVHMFSPNDFFNPERVTKISYQIADAMIKAREKTYEVDRNNTMPDRDSTDKS